MRIKQVRSGNHVIISGNRIAYGSARANNPDQAKGIKNQKIAAPGIERKIYSAGTLKLQLSFTLPAFRKPGNLFRSFLSIQPFRFPIGGFPIGFAQTGNGDALLCRGMQKPVILQIDAHMPDRYTGLEKYQITGP